MCGIAGILDPGRRLPPGSLGALAEAMAERIVHRGPDAGGAWADADAGIALGHRRLSILDLSETGRQPMESADGRFVIAFNGEIYNFKDIRAELARSGDRFRGHSDTEVMLAAFSRWGIADSVRRFRGMFAFALWDRLEGNLHLGRDRIGEKPLYYGRAGGVFLFASELKAFRAFPDWRPEIDRDALALYFKGSCVPAPYSIFKGIGKLPPGTLLRVPGTGPDAGAGTSPEPYWSLAEVAEAGIRDPFRGGEAEAADELERRLRAVIGDQMIADVPLGAFLSGGVDSSAVVALMQAQSTRPVRTFTIGFHEKSYDEATHAKAIARHLGTEHTEMYVDARAALEVVPSLPEVYDEPFADYSQIPTLLLSRLTRRHVTVCLSGDGGDELLGGYNRYHQGPRIWNRVRRIPRGMRKLASAAVGAVPSSVWEGSLAGMEPLLPMRVRQINIPDKLEKFLEVMAAGDAGDIYPSLVTHWKDSTRLVPGSRELATRLSDRDAWPRLPDFVQTMIYLDTMTYLPDDIMVKVDRAAMHASLESRAPYLDHELVAFAWSLPLAMKIKDGRGKHLLREVLHRHVPRGLMERPKMGFAIPMRSWLRGPLREWAEDLLGERRLREEGILDAALVRRAWSDNQSGRRNLQSQIWCILMFQAWLAAQKEWIR